MQALLPFHAEDRKRFVFPIGCCLAAIAHLVLLENPLQRDVVFLLSNASSFGISCVKLI